MRNLKKILALVLALVMSMSLMATAGAFEDEKDIDPTFDEAITVLSNLKVFQGYDDGKTFQPKGAITRAEVAAIIYRIATGDVEDKQVNIYSDYKQFDDVKSTAWYAGYVNYCANAKLIKGYDANTFGPNDPVTGYQALAMILRAVGYDKNGEFTGTRWTVETAAKGKELHITDNVNATTLNSNATREVVAEILFRAILVPQVTYTPSLGYQSIGVTHNSNIWTGWFVDNASIGYETFGLEKTAGEISAVGRAAGTTTMQVETTGKFGRPVLTPVTVTNTDANWENIGYAAYAYTVPTAGVKTREAVSDLTVTGVSLKATTDGTTVDKSGVVVEAGSNVYFNGELMGQTAAANQAQVVTSILNKAGLRGVKVDYIDNDNGGRAEVIVVTEYTVAQVKAVTTENSTTGWNGSYENTVYLSNNGTSAFAVKASNLVTNDELAVGDWTTYVQYPWANNAKGDYYVTEAPATTGKYVARIYSTVAPTMYAIGDTNYYVSDLEYVTDYTKNNGAATVYLADNQNQSKDVTIFTDPYGYIVVANANVVANNYLYVISNAATNPNTGLTEAVVALADGTVATVSVANLAINNANPGYVYSANALVGMHTYTVNEAGYYKLGAEQDKMTNATYKTKTATITGLVGSVASSRKVDLNTVIVDLRDYKVGTTNVPVYTGYNEIPTVQNTVIWVNTGAANAAVTVGFLLQNSNTITQDFIVYQTQEYRQVIGGLNNLTTGYVMDVLVDDAVSKDFALTNGQFDEIRKYGVGLYSFVSNDGGKTFTLVEYTSFDEVWDTAVWGTGVITWKGNNYPYNEQNLVVIDVDNRTVHNNLALVWGETSKAYVANPGKANQIVYAILGTEASATSAGVSHPEWYKDATTYKYNRANAVINGVVTDLITTIYSDTAHLYDVTVNGQLSSWVDLPAGTKITLPQTTGSVATQQEYVKVTVAGADKPTYEKVGTEYTVTANTALETGYYEYTINGASYYVKGDTTQVKGADVTTALGKQDGMYYLWKWNNAAVATDGTTGTGFAAHDDQQYAVTPATYSVKEITTGFWKVTTAAGGKTTADATVYTEAGAAVDAGTELTASTAYYAKVNTTFTWTQDNTANVTHTVKAENTSDFVFGASVN